MRTAAQTTRRILVIGAVAMMMAAALLLTGCTAADKSSANSGGEKATKTRELTLVAYSIPEVAYRKIIPAFQAYWKNKTGENVKFTESYGGSGAQARAVSDGLEADVVHLAMEPDVNKIAKAGLIKEGWQERTKGKGIPTTSLIVLGVRPGNPKGIADWADVSRAGVGVITPDPKTSGGAKWNLLASYGSVSLNGGTGKQAEDQVLGLYKNAVVLDKSARDASNTFLKKGLGDVALLWESDANIGKAEGGTFDIVIPKSTILAETAATVVDETVDKKGTRDVAEAFVDFLFGTEAQKAFAETGLRPVDPDVLAQYADKYPQPAGKLFTIADFGGWKQANAAFFDDGALYPKVEAAVAAGK